MNVRKMPKTQLSMQMSNVDSVSESSDYFNCMGHAKYSVFKKSEINKRSKNAKNNQLSMEMSKCGQCLCF